MAGGGWGRQDLIIAIYTYIFHVSPCYHAMQHMFILDGFLLDKNIVDLCW